MILLEALMQSQEDENMKNMRDMHRPAPGSFHRP